MEYLCEDCGQKGDAADFPDLVCPECDATVVTSDQAAKNLKLHEEFMKGKDYGLKKLLDETDF